MYNFTSNNLYFDYFEILQSFKLGNPSKFINSDPIIRITEMYGKINVPYMTLKINNESQIQLDNLFFSGPWLTKYFENSFRFERKNSNSILISIYNESLDQKGEIKLTQNNVTNTYQFDTSISSFITNFRILNFDFIKIYSDATQINNVDIVSLDSKFNKFNFKIGHSEVNSTNFKFENRFNDIIAFNKSFNIYFKSEMDDPVIIDSPTINFNLSID